ncbi:MAG: SRPBCC family protein [Hyphomicrobiaceae bacterium]|nr:SRPBCC family protein [Hyphomicrobiaceae bacterium]
MRLETVVGAPPERVFAALVDIAGWPQRIAAIRRIEFLSDGPLAVGSRFRETRMMFGREAVEEMTVAAIEAPSRLVLTACNHGTDYRMTHLVEPSVSGTRLTLVFEGVPRTLAARLLAPLGRIMIRSVRKHMEGDLADLKRHIEGGGEGG